VTYVTIRRDWPARAGRRALSRLTSKSLYYIIALYMSEPAQFKAEFFKALGHPLRIRVLDALRGGEVGVNDLCARLQVEQSTLSQQLGVLRSRNIVTGRKDGLNVYYSVRDKTLFKLLDVAREVFNNHLIDVQDMLSQMEPPRRGRK
jgi:DNA-binding transcriptional ArsR family regulator